MLNKLLILCTEFIGYLLVSLKFDKNIRQHSDLRLVLYHGIGGRDSACMKYLNDEIPLETFKAHIDYLEDRYALLSLKDAVSYLQKDQLPKSKPVCNISFDDGLHSVYTYAFPLLKERGIPFDVFVNTYSTGNNVLLWLHALNHLLSTFGPHDVSNVISRLIGGDIPVVEQNAIGIEHWFRKNFEYCLENDLIGKLYENYGVSIEETAAEQKIYLDWDQIEEMSNHNVGFYSHTHSHFPLNAFTSEELIKTEIKTAYDILQAHHINNDFVSFPFGMEVDYGKRNIKHALSTGHKLVVEVGGGINSLDRIEKNKILSRISLGDTGTHNAYLYAAIEIRPAIKMRLKSLINKIA